MKYLYWFVVPQCVIQNEMRNEQFFHNSVFWGWLVLMKCKTQGGGGGGGGESG